jgi:hypothetical protein
MANPRDPSGGAATGPARRTVASYPTYRQAEQAVDHLADEGFPVENVAIVARDLHFVEQVTGRMGYPEAALRGALPGALAGVLIGWLFGIFDWFEPLLAAAWLAFQGLWVGALVGALVGMAMHALMRGRRDFASVAGMTADRFDVVADEGVAEHAAQLLANFKQAPPLAPVPTEPDGPAKAA